jgi:membrane-associated phospholipid phosphatase
MVHLRASEWISALGFLASWLLAWRPGLNSVRRAKITALASAGVAATLFPALALPRLVTPLAASLTRDSIPCLVLLLFYSKAGQFVTRTDIGLEAGLQRLDRRWVMPMLEWCSRQRLGAWIIGYLELAYLSYYIAMPLAIGSLYWSSRAREADHFWTVVLLAAYGSTGMLAFIQTRPPWIVGDKWSVKLPASKLRALNLWILRRGSIRANTFPSAHVAIATAAALVMLEVGPLWAGTSLLVAAISIAVGAVAGRYHYALDAILGFLVAVAALLAGNVLLGRTGTG